MMCRVNRPVVASVILTVAAGLAQLAAEHGKRVLVCEVDAKGDVTSLFEAPPTDFTPREIAPGVWSMSISTSSARASPSRSIAKSC